MRGEVNGIRSVWTSRTERVSFENFWTSLVFAQTPGVVNEIYPIFLWDSTKVTGVKKFTTIAC